MANRAVWMLAIAAGWATAAQGSELGSDAYGYLATDADYSYYGLGAAGQEHSLGGDGEVTVALPWDFEWYGVTYTQLTVGANGGVSFGGAVDIGDVPYCLPASLVDEPDIAVFWEDLYASANRVWTDHVLPEDVFVVTWQNVTHLGLNLHFQLRLEPSGRAVLTYPDAYVGVTYNNNPTASIGIQNATGGTAMAGDALSLFCNELPENQTAYAFEICWDVDGDGFHDMACSGEDCDDGNAAVNPGMVDVCDGVDAACDGLALLVDEVPPTHNLSPIWVGGNVYEVSQPTTLDAIDFASSLSAGETLRVAIEVSESPGGPFVPLVTSVLFAGSEPEAWRRWQTPGVTLRPGTYYWISGHSTNSGNFQYNASLTAPLATSFGTLVEGRRMYVTSYGDANVPDPHDPYAMRLLTSVEADRDGDGWLGCEDCDDVDPAIYPGATERCNGLDDDCDGVLPIDEDDLDGDGSPGCEDCDDADPLRSPTAVELCDGVDNNCDGVLLRGELEDLDGDGFLGCEDCDDTDPTVYPGAAEICDGVDQDCDGLLTTVDALPMAVGQNYNAVQNHALQLVRPTETVDLSQLEVYGDISAGSSITWIVVDCEPVVGVANKVDCVPVSETTTTSGGGLGWHVSGPLEAQLLVGREYAIGVWVWGENTLYSGAIVEPYPLSFGTVDGYVYNLATPLLATSEAVVSTGFAWTMRLHTEPEVDSDGDGWLGCEDCYEGRADTYPGAPELCDRRDNDCDGAWTPEETDDDGDGFNECADLDCDDTEPTIHPGATELCDARDTDCDGATPAYELVDADNDGSPFCLDCNEADPDVSHLLPEVCDGVDTNCDGVLYEELWESPQPTVFQRPSEYTVGNQIQVDANGKITQVGVWIDPDDPWDDVTVAIEVWVRDGITWTQLGFWPHANPFDGPDWYWSDRLDVDVEANRTYFVGVRVTDVLAQTSSWTADPLPIGTLQGGNARPDFWDTPLNSPLPEVYHMQIRTSRDVDVDGDLSPSCLDCDDNDPTRAPDFAESCDRVDNDCDGVVPPDETDDDLDGLTECEGDCDDTLDHVLPGAPELCNGIDDDCDGVLPLDEYDADADSFMVCEGDCDDNEPQAWPGREEICDFIDNDCDGEGDTTDLDIARGSLWSSGFEGTTGGSWTDFSSGPVSHWEHGVPTGPSPSAFAGSDVWGTVLAGNYIWSNTLSHLYLPPVVLGTNLVLPPALRFAYWQSNDDAGQCGPHTTVIEIGDGFGNWTDIDDGDGCPYGLEDTDGLWVEREIDLSAWAGQQVEIRFTHSTVAPGFAELGTYLDEVQIVEWDDDDLDGWASCLDCDNGDPAIFPGAVEVCDGVDNDCDGLTLPGEVDADGDGFLCDDCDDADPTVYPGAVEVCDGVDNDCDGTYGAMEFEDVDGDGYPACNDCDDNDPTRNPGAVELCDGVDNDCDGVVPTTELDGDGDGQAECEGDCDDTNPLVVPGQLELCDGLDNDCNGAADVAGAGSEADLDADGFVACEDCDDTNPAVHPGATEVCDGLDNDCDGLANADFYGERDADGDGVLSCADCNDTEAAVFPGAVEICNGINDDCDPATDENADLDGDGYSLCTGDCDDTAAAVLPGAIEVCDGVDNDCDPTTDEDGDADGDGFSICDGDCAADDPSRSPGEAEQCNGVDDDCDGVIPADELDSDGDGVSGCEGDCDDSSDQRSPLLAEICGDGIDNDCDGTDQPCDPGVTGTGTGTGTGTPGTGSGGTATGTATGGPDTGDEEPKGGCGCQSSGSGGPWMLLLGLVALRRRRQAGPR